MRRVVAVWAAIAFPLWAALGGFLQANTHHRGLAGATFGVGAVVIGLAAGLVARRIVGSDPS